MSEARVATYVHGLGRLDHGVRARKLRLSVGLDVLHDDDDLSVLGLRDCALYLSATL